MTWNLTIYPEVASTNQLCRNLPAWSAVRAEKQTAGRGRHGREWCSGEGGLWLSAVIPAPGPREKWETLPLTTGCVILETLKKLGVRDARLRWPNDVMIGEKKLCGILVERFSSDTAVIGIGLNVCNEPEKENSSLKGNTTRLADLMVKQKLPSLDHLAQIILQKLAKMQQTIEKKEWSTYRNALNRTWRGEKTKRQVECALGKGKIVCGVFLGVDEAGNLLLQDPKSKKHTLNAGQVELLKEVDY